MAVKKKTAAKKKTVSTKRAAAARKANATRKRNELTHKLRADLKATREALKQARAEAREELKLARAAAKAEAAVLKDQLNAALKREQELMKISQQKIKTMWAAGQKWEKAQIAKIQRTFKAKRTQKT